MTVQMQPPHGGCENCGNPVRTHKGWYGWVCWRCKRWLQRQERLMEAVR